jgi:hypothetical protein
LQQGNPRSILVLPYDPLKNGMEELDYRLMDKENLWGVSEHKAVRARSATFRS